MGQLVELFPDNMDDRIVAKVVRSLMQGGIIIYPTDTVYSMGCSLQSPAGLERLAKIKGVKPDKANFSIVCSDLSDLSDYSKQVDNHVFKLMKSLLPGPYTFILEASKSIPRLFNGNKKTVGIRIPDHPIALRLVEELGCPIIVTSVKDDDSFMEYPTDAERIFERWENEVDFVIDGGPGGFEVSTVLDCSDGNITLVRQGKGSVEGLGI